MMLTYVIGVILAPLRTLRRWAAAPTTPPILQVAITKASLMTSDAILTQVEDLYLHHPDAAGVEVILRGASFDQVKQLVADITEKNTELAPSVQLDTGLTYGRNGHLLFSPVRHAE
jgi:hypothetical protein